MERLHYRDRLRAARYLALADAEGFGHICFAIEALGLRLKGREATLGKYVRDLRALATRSPLLSTLAVQLPMLFKRFDALYETVQKARNDAMHTGVYARYATSAAIELSIGLEDALMEETQTSRQTVADYMVRSPVVVERWQPVAHARQLMLMHSFSFLPVFIGTWKLVPELSMARFLHRNPDRKALLAMRIEDAATQGLDLLDAVVVDASDNVADTLRLGDAAKSQLWLVRGPTYDLCGVLSPFELM